MYHARTTFIDIFNRTLSIYIYIYMNVPTYLLAQNVHGPRFTSPIKCKRILRKMCYCLLLRTFKCFAFYDTWITNILKVGRSSFYLCLLKKTFPIYIYKNNPFITPQIEGYSLDQIKMTEWIWPKSVNMTEIGEHDQKIDNEMLTWWTWPKI